MIFFMKASLFLLVFFGLNSEYSFAVELDVLRERDGHYFRAHPRSGATALIATFNAQYTVAGNLPVFELDPLSKRARTVFFVMF